MKKLLMFVSCIFLSIATQATKKTISVDDLQEKYCVPGIDTIIFLRSSTKMYFSNNGKTWELVSVGDLQPGYYSNNPEDPQIHIFARAKLMSSTFPLLAAAFCVGIVVALLYCWWYQNRQIKKGKM